MATIFRGKDLLTGAVVAIKVPQPETECDPGMFDRFRRESRSCPHGGGAVEWIGGTTLRTIPVKETIAGRSGAATDDCCL